MCILYALLHTIFSLPKESKQNLRTIKVSFLKDLIILRKSERLFRYFYFDIYGSTSLIIVIKNKYVIYIYRNLYIALFKHYN